MWVLRIVVVLVFSAVMIVATGVGIGLVDYLTMYDCTVDHVFKSPVCEGKR